MHLRQAAEAMKRWFRSEEYQRRQSEGRGTEELLSLIDRHIEGINKTMLEIEETDKRIRHLLNNEEQFSESIMDSQPRRVPHLQVVKS